jgi:hypothetical protein
MPILYRTKRKATNVNEKETHMSHADTLITDEMKHDICTRAKTASTQFEVVEAIFDVLREAAVEFDQVPLESWKGVLVEALRSAQQANIPQPTRIAA